VERADNPALHQRPEAFDGLSVNRADNVLALGMVDTREGIIGSQPVVSGPLVGAEQANFSRNGLTGEFGQGAGVDILDNARNHIALAAYRSCDWRLARTDTARSVTAAALVPMPILRLPANEGFVQFHNADQFCEVLIGQPSSYPMAHIPSGFVGTETHVAEDLKRADPLLAGQHQMNDAEPLAKVDIGVFENGADQYGEPIAAAVAASVADPMKGASMGLNIGIAATWANNEFRPAMFSEVQLAGIFIREHPFEIQDGHLMDRLALLPARHAWHSPTVRR